MEGSARFAIASLRAAKPRAAGKISTARSLTFFETSFTLEV